MREQLTEHDVEKIKEEIEYRKLVVRILNIMQQRRTRTRMRAGSVIWREC